jgi:hypothetical protein
MIGISKTVPRNRSPRAGHSQRPSAERAGAAETHAGQAALSSFLAGSEFPQANGENELIL